MSRNNCHRGRGRRVSPGVSPGCAPPTDSPQDAVTTRADLTVLMVLKEAICRDARTRARAAERRACKTMQDELHTAILTLQINKIGAIRVPHVSAEERSATITVGCYETRTRRLQVHIHAIPDDGAGRSVAGLDTLHVLGKSGSHLSLKSEDNLVADAAFSDGSTVECGFEKTNLQASPESAPIRTIVFLTEIVNYFNSVPQMSEEISNFKY